MTAGVFGVANLKQGQGRICNSNYWADGLFGGSVLGFNGALEQPAQDATDLPLIARCGTSFAAPRVAWILAALQQRRTSVDGAWPLQLSDAVRGSRTDGDMPWKGYLEIEKLIHKLN